MEGEREGERGRGEEREIYIRTYNNSWDSWRPVQLVAWAGGVKLSICSCMALSISPDEQQLLACIGQPMGNQPGRLMGT